jgi:hypothetical protein
VAACRNHPDVSGVGICVRCKTVICAECCTRLRGINHCPECLRELAEPTPPPAVAGTLLAAFGIVTLGCAVLFGLFLLVQGRLAP